MGDLLFFATFLSLLSLTILVALTTINIVSTKSAIDALLAFGFTEIEAQIYCFLLEQSPATGYRISHAIGKAAANTYKALTALEQKGAIIVESGENRLCRATPPDELLAALSQTFDSKCTYAKKVFASLPAQTEDHRVYQLTTAEQVICRARAMLEGASQVAVFDIMPMPALLLAEDVQLVTKRKIKIAAITYEPNEAFATETCLLAHDAKNVLAKWPGQQINLVVDARETLLALLSRDCSRVVQAVWTNSRYLSVFHYNSITSELLGHKYRELVPKLRTTDKTLQQISQIALTKARPPGFDELLREARRTT
jgi:predicted transcriptional regulator